MYFVLDAFFGQENTH